MRPSPLPLELPPSPGWATPAAPPDVNEKRETTIHYFTLVRQACGKRYVPQLRVQCASCTTAPGRVRNARPLRLPAAGLLWSLPPGLPPLHGAHLVPLLGGCVWGAGQLCTRSGAKPRGSVPACPAAHALHAPVTRAAALWLPPADPGPLTAAVCKRRRRRRELALQSGAAGNQVG